MQFQETQQQANVRLEMAEPEVRFEQAEGEAKVTVEQQEPQINIQRAEGGEEGQQQQLVAGGQKAADQQAGQAQAPTSNEHPTPTGSERLQESAGAGAQDETEHQAQAGGQRPAEGQQPMKQTEQQGQATATGAQPEQHKQVAATEEQLPATRESPLAAMPASDVIGTEVQNAEGDTVAEIVDLVKEQGAENLYAVLSVGGFLGIGDKKVVVPLEELDVGQEGEIVMANVTEDQLKNMPEYNEQGYESTAGLEEQPAEPQQPQPQQ